MCPVNYPRLVQYLKCCLFLDSFVRCRPYYVLHACSCQALCYPLFWTMKDCYPESPSSLRSFAPHSSTVTEHRTRQKNELRVFSLFDFCLLYCVPLAVLFVFLARKDLPLVEYAVEISQLAILTAFDDAALNSLFWIGANYHHPVDLPNTTGLSCREAIIRCLESVSPRSRAQPDPEPSPPSPRCAKLKPDCAFTPDATCANKSRYSLVVGCLNILNLLSPFAREIRFTTDTNSRHGRGFCHCKQYRQWRRFEYNRHPSFPHLLCTL